MPRMLLAAACGIVFLPALVAAQQKSPVCSQCHPDIVRNVATSAHTVGGCETCHPDHDKYPHPAGIPKPECAQCHANVVEQFGQSVHGKARATGNEAAPDCAVCHGSVHELKATNSPAFRGTIPSICGGCHTDIEKQYDTSVHGRALKRGVREVPVCTTCHGEHAILAPSSPASPVNPMHIRDTCGQCHGNVRLSSKYGLPADRVVSFDASYHGLAAAAGSQTVANCASCHGVHDILPSSDRNSTINAKNLGKTCGQCHPGAGTRFRIGPVHVLPSGEAGPVHWARIAYLIIIPVTIGLMFVHNVGDWFRKLWSLRVHATVGDPRVLPGPPAATYDPHLSDIRMLPGERVQHLLLLISFTVLVWTGFALVYPNEWWAWPLVSWERRFPVRGMIHRLASLVIIAVAITHAVSLLISRRLRKHWKTMFPKRRDVTEGFLNLAYNLGLRKRRPPISTHSYIEKAEYWAVVWGTVIMGLTGIVMWANKWVLAHWPKVALDFCTTVHFWEATLAALSILIWHFYSVIFDPDVYPMDTSWFRGVSVKRRKTPDQARPDEPDREQK